MKKIRNSFLALFGLTVLISSNIGAQCVLPEQFTGNTGVNMTVMLTSDFIDALPIDTEGAYIVVITESNLVVGSADVYGLSQNGLAIWGDDETTDELDGALVGEFMKLFLVNGGDLYIIVPIFGIGSNAFEVNGLASLIGCKIELYCSAEDDGLTYEENVDGFSLLDTDIDRVYDELEINDFDEPEALEPVLYPNPASNKFFLSVNNTYKLLNVQVINTLGTVFIERQLREVQPSDAIQFIVEDLPNGIYMLKVSSDTDSLTIPWVKR